MGSDLSLSELRTRLKAALVNKFRDERSIDAEQKYDSVGEVISVSDGVAIIFGLYQVGAGEMVEFLPNKIHGMVLNLESGFVKVVIFGDPQGVSAGDMVSRLNYIISVPVGRGLVGRVVDSLGSPIDGLGALSDVTQMPLDEKAPGIIKRQSVNQPLYTGLKVIDSMIPIGKGQRELILGDRQTGKTSIGLDAIINQYDLNSKSEDKDKVFCIYVAIGQKRSSVARIFNYLHNSGCMNYSVIVAATASESAPLQYLAPYSGCTIAEYFRNNGLHSLVIYDDLSKHAVAYRQMSLLLRRPPGREAYPGDIFYLHSRLLERAAKMSTSLMGGSLTALPIVETQAGDVSGYISTNVISITDGQIFLETDYFHRGIRPAVNAGLSVSRVGSAAQISPMKKLASSLKLELAQFREFEGFLKFGADMDESTRLLLNRGLMYLEVLKQDNFAPMIVESQIIVLYSAVMGYLDNIPFNRIREFEEKLLKFSFSSKLFLPYVLTLGMRSDFDPRSTLLFDLLEYFNGEVWVA